MKCTYSVSEVAPNTPLLIVSPNSRFVQSATQLAMRCSSTTTGVSYKFMRNGIVVYTRDNNYMIASATTSDTGTYTCIAINNGVDSLPSSGHLVNVVGKLMNSKITWKGKDP